MSEVVEREECSRGYWIPVCRIDYNASVVVNSQFLEGLPELLNRWQFNHQPGMPSGEIVRTQEAGRWDVFFLISAAVVSNLKNNHVCIVQVISQPRG